MFLSRLVSWLTGGGDQLTTEVNSHQQIYGDAGTETSAGTQHARLSVTSHRAIIIIMTGLPGGLSQYLFFMVEGLDRILASLFVSARNQSAMRKFDIGPYI